MTSIILDNGSGFIKAGFEGEDHPRTTFPSAIGTRRISITNPLRCEEWNRTDDHMKISYVGDEAQSMRGVLSLKYPIQHGVVTNWNDMETIWRHTFSRALRVDTAEYPVLMTEKPSNSTLNKEKMIQVMFESFRVPSMSIVIESVLSLFASGRTTGIVLDWGHGVCTSVPILEGSIQRHAVLESNLCGDTMTEYMIQMLVNKEYFFSSSSEREIARELKEDVCYVALEFEEEMKKAHEDEACVQRPYQLPDGNVINIGCERFQCPEILFQPHLIGMDRLGVHEMIAHSIDSTGIEFKRLLYDNIVLSGGATMVE